MCLASQDAEMLKANLNKQQTRLEALAKELDIATRDKAALTNSYHRLEETNTQLVREQTALSKTGGTQHLVPPHCLI